MNRALSLLFAACLCVASLGGVPSASAFFTDTDESAANAVQAGVLDIKLSEVGPATRASTTDESQRDSVRDTFEDRTHSAIIGSGPVRNTLRIDNTHSSLDVERTGLVVSYTENDGLLGWSGNAESTARTIRLTQFTYRGTNLLGTTIRDENANGRYDVHDLTIGQTKQNVAALPGIPAGGTADMTVEFRGNRGLLGNLLTGGDGIDISFEIEGSAESFTDRDTSIRNTIRYA